MINKEYDIWLQWTVSPKCNLDCIYCFDYNLRHNRNKESKSRYRPFVRAMRKAFIMDLSSIRRILRFRSREANEGMAAIDIPALMKVLSATNNTFLIGFTGGGEPFLIPNIIEACEEISRRHLLGFNTNLTIPAIQEFAKRIDPGRVSWIMASLHIKQLERMNLLDRYIRNYLICKERGFAIAANSVAYPPLLGEVDTYRRFFREKGISISFAPFVGSYNGREYPKSYTEEEVKVFGLKESCRDIFYPRGNICNAGYNVAMVLPSGDVISCFPLHERIGHIYKGVVFRKTLLRCPLSFCGCPVYAYNPHLFQKAKQQADCSS
ncbi:MAG: radical SAM protein [bacterium]|nr:radical SAM protein [bacterium]